MGREPLLTLAALCALATGCSLVENATRNLLIDPLRYHEGLDRCWTSLRNRRTADAAWEEYRGQINPGRYSDDYVHGFKEGFTDYLQDRGTGAPPPVPPRQYWSVAYQSPEGHDAIEQWFAGYSQGAAMAQERGYRQWITLPSPLALPSAPSVEVPVDAPLADLPMPHALPEQPAADGMRSKDLP